MNVVRALAVCLALTLGSAVPAPASWLVPQANMRAKDFTVVKYNGLYHVFYIRHNNLLPFDQTETDLGHATSPDLYNWTHQPTVLPRDSTSWDRSHIWAPHIVERDSIFYMFYTGVANDPGGPHLLQRTGLATSTDLFQWNPYPEPIFECGQVPWSFCDSMSYASAFRDPFVMPDPAVPGDWLMAYSTSPDVDSLGMLVAMARSSGDFTQWTDQSPLWVTHHWQTGDWKAESAHLMQHDGLWYLFYTGGGPQPIVYATGADPLGDVWNFRGPIANMLGVETRGWFASETLHDGIYDYFCFINGDRVEFHRMVWGQKGLFQLTAPNPFHVVRMEWGTPAVADSDLITLAVTSSFAYGSPLLVDAVVTYDDSTVRVLAQESIGLGSTPPLQSPMTTLDWKFFAPRDSATGAWPVSVVLRTRDLTCESLPLAVAPEDTAHEEPPPPPPPNPGNSGDEPPGDFPGIRPVFRQANGAPVEGIAFLVDLPASADARVDLFDVQGRRVRTLTHRVMPSGASLVNWDGRNEAGVRAPSGLYFARLLSGGRVYSLRVALR